MQVFWLRNHHTAILPDVSSRNVSGFLAAFLQYSDGNRAGLTPASLLADNLSEHEIVSFNCF